MSGIFNNSAEDKFRERQLDEYLNNKEREEEKMEEVAEKTMEEIREEIKVAKKAKHKSIIEGIELVILCGSTSESAKSLLRRVVRALEEEWKNA